MFIRKSYITQFLILIHLFCLQSQSMPYAADMLSFQKDDSLHPKERGQIVFVGSSTFTRWTDVQNRFPGVKIINRGFGGSTLIDVFKNAATTIYKYEPRQVVIYAGENDFASDTALLAMDVFERYLQLAVDIRNNLPKAEIVFISAKPSPSRWGFASKFKEFNGLIKEFSTTQPGFKFINVWDTMINKEGKPREELFVADKLHMNKAGYDIWVPILKGYLK